MTLRLHHPLFAHIEDQRRPEPPAWLAEADAVRRARDQRFKQGQRQHAADAQASARWSPTQDTQAKRGLPMRRLRP